jgi:hypothetical protein
MESNVPRATTERAVPFLRSAISRSAAWRRIGGGEPEENGEVSRVEIDLRRDVGVIWATYGQLSVGVAIGL